MGSTWGKSRDRISNLPDAASCHFFPPNLLWELLSYQRDGGIFGLSSLILTLIMICCWIGTSLLGILEEAHGSRIFVDTVLLHGNGACIRKFRLKCNSHQLDSAVDSWICTVLELNVQELDLYFDMEYPIGLPPKFLFSRTLVLKLYFSIFLDVPSSIWFPSLKVLHLRSVVFSTDDSTQRLLSSCSVLEQLVIERWRLDEQWVFNPH